ncbi:DoxX family protein [Streptomyces sp. Inha503]|uniref:DoxX family protein n=1 Tax=Streptomyces sp. Inha503 TaxID=3383314 RepID=UPI0039A1E880
MPNPLLMLDPRKPPLTPRNTLDDTALLILRLAVGGLLVIHGFQGLGDPGHRIALSRGFGVPFPEVASWLSILGEIGTSLAVVAGLLTRLSAVLMTVLMTTTWLTSSLGKPLIGGRDTPASATAAAAGVVEASSGPSGAARAPFAPVPKGPGCPKEGSSGCACARPIGTFNS